MTGCYHARRSTNFGPDRAPWLTRLKRLFMHLLHTPFSPHGTTWNRSGSLHMATFTALPHHARHGNVWRFRSGSDRAVLAARLERCIKSACRMANACA
jgi:hypothetical protein